MKVSDIFKMLEARHYKKGYTPAAEQIALKIDNRVIGTIGNFVTFSGLAKAGKSTFISSTIASAMHIDKNLYGISLRPSEERETICYIDTESSEYDFYKNLDKIKVQANINELPWNFNAYSVREDDPGTIRMLIEEYLKGFPRCSIMIIDGLLDINSNFNDEIESKKTITWLKKITKIYNVLIIGVIHLARKDQQLLGHFGSMLERYSQSVLEVRKDQETGILQLFPKYLRSDKDFMPIAINWVGNGFEKCMPPTPKQEYSSNKKSK